MNRKISPPFSILILIVSSLACAQASSSGGSLADIVCALQGESCKQAPTGGGGGGGGLSIPTTTPLSVETLVPTMTPTPTPRPSSALKVVYIRDGDIWLWDQSVDLPRKLTDSGVASLPKISEDGLVVAFRQNGELWAVNSDGGNQRVLATGSALAALTSDNGNKTVEPRHFDFAPQSHNIYMNINVVNDSRSVPEGLGLVNADSPSLQVLLGSNQGGQDIIFSPDGTKIALPRSDKISVVNSDGSNFETVFLFSPIPLETDTYYIPQIVWMPNNSGFTTVIPFISESNKASTQMRFYYISTDGGPFGQLAEFIAVPVSETQPYISPDGSKVLYMKPQGEDLELRIIDASTTDQGYLRYDANKLGLLGWAHDSKQVMYWVDDQRRVWIASPEKQPVLLSDVVFATNVTWVDAKRYLFLNGSELRLRTEDQPSILIDAQVDGGDFDFMLRPGE